MLLKTLIKKIESKYPLSLAYDWDNVGLLVGDFDMEVNKVLVVLEANEKVIDEAIENNSFDNLPQSIRDKYTIKDYICYYDFTEERKRETQAFIQAKIEDIEMFEDNKNWWEPKEITPYTSFYCQNLCRSSQSL